VSTGFRSSKVAHNVKALAIVAGFMASSAWLPMPDKGKIFKLIAAAH
jgi:hypothetical protein